MKTELICPQCNTVLKEDSKFCHACGAKVDGSKNNNPRISENVVPKPGGPPSGPAQAASNPSQTPPEPVRATATPGQPIPEPVRPYATRSTISEERKLATVLFSDLSGFTAMSEKLDPEEVKEIMSKLFSRCSEIVNRYDGYIDKFIGDCVMIVFGVPRAHENDAERAVRTALEIHKRTLELNTPELTETIGRTLSMHSGINTGLVITGDLDIAAGKEKVLGDTVNVASRLTGLAGPGEIVVGETTFHSTERFFEYTPREPASVKGKTEKVRAFAYKAQKSRPDSIRRLSGRRAAFIGRQEELRQLNQALEGLELGKASIITLVGEAGTGKSRLVAEFAKQVKAFHFRIITAYTYSHSLNISYSLWIDLLTRLIKINEDDGPDQAKQKIDEFYRGLDRDGAEEKQFIHYLFSIISPEVKAMEAGFLKSGIEKAITDLLQALCRREKCVFIYEDLHWADPSSLELLRTVLSQPDLTALFLCVQRPTESGPTPGITMRLQPLSQTNEREMLQSLLECEEVPGELEQYVCAKSDGNPFFIEEIINNLIEIGYLKNNGCWEIDKSISISAAPNTIQEIILERIDRLNNETKKVIQVASVIGRTFYYSILENIIRQTFRELSTYMQELEAVDFIRKNDLEEEIEYMFKHALLQETIYYSVLNRDKKIIHEKIAGTIEELFGNRLHEFYETLAFHYEKAENDLKAVDYLIKAGEKSYERYATLEADAFYRRAYERIVGHFLDTEEGPTLLFDLLGKWGFVHYSIGSFFVMEREYEKWADRISDIKDKNYTVLYLSWLGWAQFCMAKIEDGEQSFRKAIDISEQHDARAYLAYTHCWYATLLLDTGVLTDCIEHAELAVNLAIESTDDLYIWSKSVYICALALAYTGRMKEAFALADEALGRLEHIKHSRARCLIYNCLGDIYKIRREHEKALHFFLQGLEAAKDPFYKLLSVLNSAENYFELKKKDELHQTLQITDEHNRKHNVVKSTYGFYSKSLESGQKILASDFGGAMSIITDLISKYRQAGITRVQIKNTIAIGKVYLALAAGQEKLPLTIMLKNLGFFMRNLPVAYKRGVSYFTWAIELAEKTGNRVFLADALLHVGKLYRIKKKKSEAKSALQKALTVLEETDMDDLRAEVKRELEKL